MQIVAGVLSAVGVVAFLHWLSEVLDRRSKGVISMLLLPDYKVPTDNQGGYQSRTQCVYLLHRDGSVSSIFNALENGEVQVVKVYNP